MTAGCVADIDVAVSVFIIFQRSFCKCLQVVSKVLVLVLAHVAPVLVNITAYYWTTSLLLQTLYRAVCMSVCGLMVTTVSPAKTAEPIEMPCGV